MTAIYSTINSKIQAILDGTTTIVDTYAYPTTKIDNYPAVIYYPSTFENSFESTGTNFKIYGYKLWIVVNTEGTTIANAFSSILPNAVDEVLQAFDDGWDFSTIDGHRVWTKVETGGWTVSEENSGVEVTAEIDLQIKMLTTVS